MADGARVAETIPGAYDYRRRRIPGHAGTRRKLFLRRIERRLRSIDAELEPFCQERIEECEAVVQLAKRLVVLPSQASVQGQFRSEFNIILQEERIGPGARGNERRLALELGALVRDPEKVVSKRIACGASVEWKIAGYIVWLVIIY